MSVLTAAVVAKLALATLVVSETVLCPDRALLKRTLVSLGAPDPEPRPETIELRQTWLGLELTAHDSGGRLIALQLLPTNVPCDSLTEAAAVVLAGWMAQWPELPSPLPRLEVKTPAPTVAVQAAGPPPPVPHWHLEVNGAVAASATSAGTTTAGLLEAGFFRPQNDWGGVLSLTAEGARGSPLTPGNVAWDRTSVSLGPAWRWNHPLRSPLSASSFQLEVGAGAALAAAFASGQAVPGAGSAWLFNPGGELRVRAAVSVGAVQCFLGLWPTLWAPVQARIAGTDASFPLPQFEFSRGRRFVVGPVLTIKKQAPVRSGPYPA